MTIYQFLIFMVFPIGAGVAGYVVMRMSENETKRFDEKRKLGHSH